MVDTLVSFGPVALVLLGGLIVFLFLVLPLLIWGMGLRARLAATAKSEAVFEARMAQLANEALHQNRESLLSMTKQSLDSQQQLAVKDLENKHQGIHAMLKPLKETVDQYRQQTQNEQGQLRQQITNLTALGQDMNRQAIALRQALTSGPKGAGAWGEQQLRNVMVMAGMAEHVDFDLQPTTQDEEGRRLRPDARVHLAGGGSLIIDAKAPTEAFLNAYEADGPQAKLYLEEFCKALRRHVEDLGAKGYWNQFSPAPEFVVLFLPNDAMLMTAFDHQPDLLEMAMNKRVILASPSTLIALLTTVAHGWRQDSLKENAEQIARLGKELYDAMATLGGHYDSLGKAIEGSAKAYNKMLGSMEVTVMPKARKFRDLQMDPGMKTLSEPKALEALHVNRPRPDRDLQLPLDGQIVDQAGIAERPSE